MKVIDRKKEQEEVRQLEHKEKQKRELQQKQIKEELEERTISFTIGRGAFSEFLETMKNGGLTRVYSELTNAYFLSEQLETAHKFLQLALRDRHQIKELIINDYTDRNIGYELILMSDTDTTNTLKREATKLGLDYATYLRAIFYNKAYQINQDTRDREQRFREDLINNQPIEIKGYISRSLRDKLESKYGKCHSTIFGIETSGYFDMLTDLAEEYFCAQVAKK